MVPDVKVSRRGLTNGAHEIDLILSFDKRPCLDAIGTPENALVVQFDQFVCFSDDLSPVALPTTSDDLPRFCFVRSQATGGRKSDVLASECDPLLVGHKEGGVRLECALEVVVEVLLDDVPLFTKPHHGPLDVPGAMSIHGSCIS